MQLVGENKEMAIFVDAAPDFTYNQCFLNVHFLFPFEVNYHGIIAWVDECDGLILIHYEMLWLPWKSELELFLEINYHLNGVILVVVQINLKFIDQENFLLWSPHFFILQDIELKWDVIHLWDHFSAVQKLDILHLSGLHPLYVGDIEDMDIKYLTVA